MYMPEQKKNGNESHGFASSLTVRNTRRAWNDYPLQHSHAQHDYP